MKECERPYFGFFQCQLPEVWPSSVLTKGAKHDVENFELDLDEQMLGRDWPRGMEGEFSNESSLFTHHI